MDDRPQDKTAMSFWFPQLIAAGIPVPKTEFLTMPREAQEDIWKAFDGEEDSGAFLAFCASVAAVGERMGYPIFLRTDHTSNKHSWDEACFVPNAAAVPSHLFQICEFSELCDFIGLPYKIWAVREFLPTIPLGICPHYGNMPICREFRFFVDEGKVRCWHPYWPEHALQQGGAVGIDFESVCRADDIAGLTALAEAAGRAVPGSWSIDILETKRGWFVTDMAEAHKSYHWEECQLHSQLCSEAKC